MIYLNDDKSREIDRNRIIFRNKGFDNLTYDISRLLSFGQVIILPAYFAPTPQILIIFAGH